MKTQFLVVFALFFGILSAANADVIVKNPTAERYAQEAGSYNDISMEDARTIQILENDIRILDAEIKKCEKSKKGWIAGTVIGSAGVAATGIAAIVQGVQISKAKDEKKALEKETAALKAENNPNSTTKK